jgi:hypothetical protein
MQQRVQYRSFLSYIDRTREYYGAHGYSEPFAWAHHREVPFTALAKPLSECRVGLMTTAGPPDAEAQDLADGKVTELYALGANPPPTRLMTEGLAWDKEATHTDDIESYLPLNRLSEYAAEGRIGSASPRFYGVPTDYSVGRTMRRYAPQLLEWCREDSVDAVLLSGL